MFRKLGEVYRKMADVYRNVVGNYQSKSFKTRIPLAALGVALPFLCALEARAEAERNVKPDQSIEIAMAAGNNVKNSEKPFIIWKYDGNGGYKPVYENHDLVNGGFHPIGAGDLDGDGKQEVVVGSINRGLHIITHKNGKYESKLADAKWVNGITTGDTDGNKIDEIFTIEGTSILRWYRMDNNGDILHKELGNGRMMYGNVAIGDPDGDGRSELVVTNRPKDGYTMILENDNGMVKVEHVLGIDWERNVREDEIDFRNTLECAKQGACPVPDGVDLEKIDPGELYAFAADQNVRKVIRENLGYDGDYTNLLFYGLKWGVCVGGPGSRDILIWGSIRERGGGRFQIVRHTDQGGYQNFFMSDKLLPDAWIYASTFGDADNDGRPDVVVGSDRILVYKYDQDTLTKIWESDKAVRSPGISSLYVGDTDGDGLNEIVASFKKVNVNNIPSERLVVFGNSGSGKNDFSLEWESEDFPGFISMMAGDFDGK